jgi:ribosomal protein S18 acetylase RimI-like enzyme
MPAPKMDPLILRRYRASDFETLYAIDQECFPSRIAYGRLELRIYLRSAGSHCIVAEMGGVIAGFVLTEISAELAHVITLDVLEPYRRKSIGSRLLEAAERGATTQGAACMYLETATTNKAAIALWKKHGYREMGTLKNYYGGGLDAFEMQKLLPQPTEGA